MDKVEAKAILLEQLGNFRRFPYANLQELVRSKKIKVLEVSGKSGTRYQLEFQAFWDSQPNANIRMLGSIDDGGWRAFFPLTESFIISPNGSFIGE